MHMLDGDFKMASTESVNKNNHQKHKSQDDFRINQNDKDIDDKM